MTLLSRNERLLALVDCDRECGLEIGPLDKPLVGRKAGRRIFYCDYADRETLQQKSANDPDVNVDLIPDIDFVTSRVTEETFGGLKFDYVLASHVIEHVPDMLAWLKHILSILTPQGRLVLAIPDKRYTFDYQRPLSTTGQVIEAYLERRARPSASQVYDGFSKAVHVRTQECWENPTHGTSLPHYFSRDFSFRLAIDAFENAAHHDCHCWVFTYDSFLEILAELRQLGLLRVRIAAKSEPVFGANEFHVVLENGDDLHAAERYVNRLVRQPPADRGKDDGWYLVKDGLRRWITDGRWLPLNGYRAEDVIEVSSDDFYEIPEGTPIIPS